MSNGVRDLGPQTSFWHPFTGMAAVNEHECTVSRGEGVYVFA
jgi:adenosylmethionine-8-amino-7-oxononanoate aminotransferase